jgi:pimeloyl-ACP methyl ester carboxylesterase
MKRFRTRGHGLSLSVVEWSAAAPRRTCLLLHGFMDAAASFDGVGPALADAGLRVLAPDLRGFGDSDRVSGGGYYHFPDYVADVDALVRDHVEGDFFLVGHSMGGTVATLYAGGKPDRVAKLALLEGRWLEELDKPPRAQTMTREDALRRLVGAHPRVPREVLASKLPHLVISASETHAEAGAEEAAETVRWKYDPMHRTTAPMPFFASVYRAYAARVSCPVLYVSGGSIGWRVPDEAERLAAFGARPAHVDLEGAGHMMHWTAPDALARALVEFL